MHAQGEVVRRGRGRGAAACSARSHIVSSDGTAAVQRRRRAVQRQRRAVHGARAGWLRTCARWSCSYAAGSATGWACGAPMKSGAPKGDCTASTSSGGTWCVRNVCAACTRSAVRSVAGIGVGEDWRHLRKTALGLDEVPAVVAGERRPRARAQAEGPREGGEEHEASEHVLCDCVLGGRAATPATHRGTATSCKKPARCPS